MSMVASQSAFKGKTRVVIMGVAGCGKSTIGPLLAARIGATYRDADDLHAPESIRKMEAGTPLSDADRWPWLDRIGGVLRDYDGTILIGCSALKRAYRDRLRVVVGGEVLFIHLAGTKAVIAQRMADRPGHFMPVGLLESQFATLEHPDADETAIEIDIDQPVKGIVDALVRQMEGTADDC